MRKNLKKVGCLLLVSAMSLSMMACGSKKSKSSTSTEANGKTLEQITTEMAEASKDMKACSIDMDFNIDVALSAQGTDLSVTASGDGEIQASQDPLQAYMNLNAEYSMMGQGQSISLEAYELEGEDGIETYTNMGNGWTYQLVDASSIDEYENSISKYQNQFDFSELKKNLDDMSVEAEGDDYEITAKITSDKVTELIGDELDSMLSEAGLTELPNFNAKCVVAVDGKTMLPKSIKLTIDLDKFELQGAEVSLKDFTINLECTSFEPIEITVPDEALAAK